VTAVLTGPRTGAGPAAPRRAPRRLLGLAALVAVLLVAAVLLGARVAGAHADRERDGMVTAIAEEATLTLLTVHGGDGRRAMDTLLEQASGDFKQQLIAQDDQFTAAVRDAKVSSDGVITEAAVQTATDEKAVVLLTADVTVRNAKAPAGQARQYRVVMELSRAEDGPWTVSKMDFAP
jgi:Mce-associated membrane protein